MPKATLPFEVTLALEEYSKHADHTRVPDITCPAEHMRLNVAYVSSAIRDEFPQESLQLDAVMPLLTAIANAIK